MLVPSLGMKVAYKYRHKFHLVYMPFKFISFLLLDMKLLAMDKH